MAADEFEQIVSGTQWEAKVPDGIEAQADLTLTYWKWLKAGGMPDKDATYLTQSWMELCVWGPDGDDDEDE